MSSTPWRLQAAERHQAHLIQRKYGMYMTPREERVAAGASLAIVEVQLDAGVAEGVATSGRERLPKRVLADGALQLV
jgi:hypothetical protein